MNYEVFRCAYDSMLPDEEAKKNVLKNIIDMASEQMPERECTIMQITKTKRTALIAVAAVMALVLMSVGAYAIGCRFFGWNRAFEFTEHRTESGISIESKLDTDLLTEPVELRDGRMIFVVNGEELDITDRVSETEGFVYEYTDASGMTHWIIVGLNGASLNDYGYAECMAEKNGDYLSEYRIRAGSGSGDAPAWYTNARQQIPWYQENAG